MYKDHIREMYDQFSAGYSRVADFVLNSYRDMAFMTAAQVAKACKVDTALVVRFAQRLGYPGYPELLKDVQEDVKRDLQAVYEPAPEERTPWAVFQRNIIEDRNSLAHVLLHVEPAQIEKVVNLLTQARRVMIVAEGTAFVVTQSLALRLSTLGFQSLVLPADIAARAAMLAGTGREDLFIGVGLGDFTPGIATVLDLAHEQGSPTVALVASVSAPAARNADVVIQTPSRSIGLMPSVTAVVSVLNALLQALAIHLGARTAHWAFCFEKYYKRLAAEGKEAGVKLPDSLVEINTEGMLGTGFSGPDGA